MRARMSMVPAVHRGRVGAPTLIEGFTGQKVLGRKVRHVWRLLEALPIISPVLPDAGVPFQLVHHDDVRARCGRRCWAGATPGTYNLAADDALRVRDIARALGWQSVPGPRRSRSDAIGEVVSRCPGARRGGMGGRLAQPVLMDTAKARRELRWRGDTTVERRSPRHRGGPRASII